MINAAQFRFDLPAFASDTTYTDDAIDYWLNIAERMISKCRFGQSAIETWPSSAPPKLTVFDHAVELFVAHNLILEAQAAKAAAGGGIPGVMSGAVQSKSVDKVSVSYDTQSAMEPNAGHWNLTVYGSRFRRLQLMAGAAPMQF